MNRWLGGILIVSGLVLGGCVTARPEIALLQGQLAGEVSTSSAILQSRMTARQVDEHGDVPGIPGVGRFIIATDPALSEDASSRTGWLEANQENDFIVKMCGKEYLGYVHVCESNRGIPGTGLVPWKEFFTSLEGIGYDGFITIESFDPGFEELSDKCAIWRKFAESGEQLAIEGLRNLKAIASSLSS